VEHGFRARPVRRWSRQTPVLVVGISFTGRHVVAALEHLAAGGPLAVPITVDHWTEFMSKDLEAWAVYRGAQLDFTRRGKPKDNSHPASSNGRLRDECLSMPQFHSLADAQPKPEVWRIDFDQQRPHGARGHLTRSEFASHGQVNRLPKAASHPLRGVASWDQRHEVK